MTLDRARRPPYRGGVPRFVKPPTPEQWAAAAAETLRENYPDAGVMVQAGPSGATRVKVRTDSPSLAFVDVWPSLKVAASGPQAARDPVLEVLHGAGYLDGYRPGATGGMRAKMPADLEDADGPPPERGMTAGQSSPAEGRTLLRTHPATPASPDDLPQACLDHIAAALAGLAPIERMDSNTQQAGRALREAAALLEPYTAAARARWEALDAQGDDP